MQTPEIKMLARPFPVPLKVLATPIDEPLRVAVVGKPELSLGGIEGRVDARGDGDGHVGRSTDAGGLIGIFLRPHQSRIITSSMFARLRCSCSAAWRKASLMSGLMRNVTVVILGTVMQTVFLIGDTARRLSIYRTQKIDASRETR